MGYGRAASAKNAAAGAGAGRCQRGRRRGGREAVAVGNDREGAAEADGVGAERE